MKWFSMVAALGIFVTGLACNLSSSNGWELTLAHAIERSSDRADADASSPAAAPNAEDEEEKLTIKKIMKLAHKSGLLKKVATGKATDSEIADLHEFYLEMPKLTPPKGEEESWEKKTAALTKASKAAVDKDPNASALLKSATDCAACHKVHK
jgi:cytochrome c553